MITQRIFAVLAAMLLVGATALGVLGPPGLPLGQVLLMIDHELMEGVRIFIGTHLSSWLWDYVMVPLMLRPAWLVPAGLGLFCGGVALSLSNRNSTQRSHRRS